MKRFHVHVAVDDLERSISFYSTLFGVPPSVTKPDYAKWMLEDPRVNFAISRRGREAGLDHLGLQVESSDELDQVRNRLVGAELSVALQSATTCCYAKSDKAWVKDPQGIAWETFLTTAAATSYAEDAHLPADEVRLAGTDATPKSACCAPSSDAGRSLGGPSR